MTSSISLIIIALNEIEGLKVIGERVNKQKTFLNEIIMVDGGSTDGSAEYAKQLGWKVFIQDENRKGIIEGLQIGIENSKSEYVIFFTPDNNCIPEKISKIHAKVQEGYDMVTVSRYFDGAKSYDDTLVTSFGNWMFTTMVNVLFRAKYSDVLGIYRCFRVNLLKELKITLKLLSISTVLCIRCKKYNKKTIDIGGDEPNRVGGKSYMSIWKNGTQELYTILKEFIIR